jgi:hypothetical protein
MGMKKKRKRRKMKTKCERRRYVKNMSEFKEFLIIKEKWTSL